MNPYHYDTPRRECQAAHRIRAAELDAWLEEVGARVIHVTDLGAAMEAQDYMNGLVQAGTDAARRIDYTEHTETMIRLHATEAAHLARRALGES